MGSARVEAIRRLGRRLAPHAWGLLVIAACMVVYLALYAGEPRAHQPDGDGYYAWLYTRSLVWDGDLHFANDYRICGDMWRNGIDRGGGRPDNPFYPGPSLFWVPVAWLLKHVLPLPPHVTPPIVQGCAGPVAKVALTLGPLLGVACIALAYRVARRFVSDGQAALATAAVAVGGSILVYATVAPSYSHVYATACTAFVLWTAIRAWERPESWWRWSIAALALSFCVFQRLNLVSMAVIPAALAAERFWRRWRALLARLAILGAGVALGLLPTLLLYKYLYGSIFMLPQGRYYVQIGHGHPLLLLFAPVGGLFFVTPAMWLPVLGIPFAIKRQRWLTCAVLVTAAMEIYVASCPLTWDAGATYGARLLTPLTPLFVLLSAFAVAGAHRWLAARPGRPLAALAIALLGPLAFMTIGLVGSKRHPQNLAGFTQAGEYGAGVTGAWEGIDEAIGDLSVLPAEILFSWRYGLPRQAFKRAAYPRTFFRDYKSMQISADVIRFADAGVTPLLRGFAAAPGGAKLTGKRGAVVFCAHWPHATRLTLAARAAHPVRLRVGLGRFYGTLWVGEASLLPAAPQTWPAFALPKGSFDSGINEIELECLSGPCEEVVVEAVRLHDDGVYAPALR